MVCLNRSAVGGLRIAGGENIDTEGLEGFEDHFSFGPCSRTRTLEIIASVKEEAGPFAVRSLMFDSGLEAGVAAHHLDFGLRSRQIFGMRFELRMRVGEVQKRHPFAVSTLIRSRRRRRRKSRYQNARADSRQTDRGGDDLSASSSLDHLPSFTLAGGNLPASRWLIVRWRVA